MIQNSQELLSINQEFLSLTTFCPKVHGKVECLVFQKEPSKKYSQKNKYNNIDSLYSYNQLKEMSNILTNSTIAGNSLRNDSTSLYAAPHHFKALLESLSQSFPDFDFSTITPWNFKLIQSPEHAQADINFKFMTILPDSDQLVAHIWKMLENDIIPSSCYIYAYESDRPDAFSAMGTVFNLNYFFLNEKTNKVILVHLREGSNEFDDEELNSFDEDDNLESNWV